jgi:hypothetical protein
MGLAWPKHHHMQQKNSMLAYSKNRHLQRSQQPSEAPTGHTSPSGCWLLANFSTAVCLGQV